MKILFVLPYVPSLIRVRSYNLVRELARTHDVSILATDGPQALAQAAALQSWCRRVEVVPFSARSALQSCGHALLRGEPLQAAVCWSPAWERRLQELLAQESFDVVHLEHLRAAKLHTAIRQDVPIVFDSVDCISLLWERTLRSTHSLKHRLIAALELARTRTYEARVLRSVDRVTVTSPVDGQALQDLAPTAAINVVANGVDLDYFRPLAGPREPATLVLSGKMSYHANVTAALHFVHDILPLLREARPDVRVRIVGSNPPRSIRDLASDPAIAVTGYVEDLREAIGGATVAICPTKVKAGIQNKVLEAMAMGLPVVSTREGVEGLAAIPGQDLLVSDSPREFANHVCELLSNRGPQERIGAAGREYVATHHRWDAAARQLESIYAAVMRSASCPERLPAHAQAAAKG